MSNENKVSIIVPVYKVEKYLPRCIESLIGQTYQNIEIILINDGSPDSCGEIIEFYADRENRIIPIHKENGGVSDARNTGMALVSGEYTFFVDGDDWIDTTLIEVLVNQLEKDKADVVQTAYYYAYQDCLQYDDRFGSQDDSPVALDNHQLMRELVLNQVVKSFVWGKLYKTNFIKGIHFQKDIIFEDVLWSYLALQRVEKYVITHAPLYYYYQHSESLIASYSLKHLDFRHVLKQRHEYVKQNYVHLVEESYKEILKASLIHYQLLLKNRRKDPNGIYRKEIKEYIQMNEFYIQGAVQEDKELRRGLTLFQIHPYVYILYLVMKKSIRMIGLHPKPKGLKRIVNIQEHKETNDGLEKMATEMFRKIVKR